MVTTQSDGVGNLVDALCGRLPASVPVQLPGAQPLRRPGILTEIGRDRGDFEEDTRETARLTEALMNLLPSEGTDASSSRRETPASAHFKDSMALVAPLILEYDDVTARQYERIVAQDAELDAMRAALETARGEMDAALEAERARDAEVGLLSNRNADYAELSARVLEFDKENGLLREQTGVMANEMRVLNVELKARAARCAELERELSNATIVTTLVGGGDAPGTSTRDPLYRDRDGRGGEKGLFDGDASRAKRELARLESRFADLKRRAHSTTTELSDSKEYIFAMEGCLRSYQAQSLDVYKQVKAAMHAAERATIQRDQSLAREKAAVAEAADLRGRLERVTAAAGEGAARLAEKRNARLTDGLKSAKRAIESLRGDNARLRASLASAKEEADRMRQERRGAATTTKESAPLPEASQTFASLTNVATSREMDEARFALRQKATDESVKQRLRHAEESLMKQQEVAAEMELSAGRTIQILREKLRRSRKDALRAAK
jgi:predicted XRE-type DNA-binding protein